MDCSPPASSVHGILQARILELVAMPSSRGSSRPRNQMGSPALQVDSLPAELSGKPQNKRNFLFHVTKWQERRRYGLSQKITPPGTSSFFSSSASLYGRVPLLSFSHYTMPENMATPGTMSHTFPSHIPPCEVMENIYWFRPQFLAQSS
ncbi:hypothetical protein R6Z07M_002183 [Ovis aries]